MKPFHHFITLFQSEDTVGMYNLFSFSFRLCLDTAYLLKTENLLLKTL